MTISTFQKLINTYYETNKRHFPWRETVDPYAIYISEMMLQQTQTDRVVPKYIAWMKRFPTAQDVADAPLSEILKYWQGLGYNRRALFIRDTASIISKNGDVFPTKPPELDALPGIGQYTAAAIVTFSTNTPHTFIETNIRRVFLHHFFADKTDISDSEILPLVEKTMDKKNPREWYWALMDYGSYLGKNMKKENPNKQSKTYSVQSKFEGSDRQIRGAILRELTQRKGSLAQNVLRAKIIASHPHAEKKFDTILSQLIKEGFIERKNSRLLIR